MMTMSQSEELVQCVYCGEILDAEDAEPGDACEDCDYEMGMEG